MHVYSTEITARQTQASQTQPVKPVKPESFLEPTVLPTCKYGTAVESAEKQEWILLN